MTHCLSESCIVKPEFEISTTGRNPMVRLACSRHVAAAMRRMTSELAPDLKVRRLW